MLASALALVSDKSKKSEVKIRRIFFLLSSINQDGRSAFQSRWTEAHPGSGSGPRRKLKTEHRPSQTPNYTKCHVSLQICAVDPMRFSKEITGKDDFSRAEVEALSEILISLQDKKSILDILRNVKAAKTYEENFRFLKKAAKKQQLEESLNVLIEKGFLAPPAYPKIWTVKGCEGHHPDPQGSSEYD